MPILKGRLGELNALGHVDPEAAPYFTPLIEFVPTGDEFDENGEPIHEKVAATVIKTGDRLERNWPRPSDVIVDLHGLPTVDGYYPVADIVDRFYNADMTQLIPTCKPIDADDPRLLERLGASLNPFPNRDICIRLSDEDLDERDEPISTSVDRLLTGLDTTPENVDLLLDFGAINETSAPFAARIARLIILDLPHLNAWKTLTLAAGGFPSNLDDIPPDNLKPVPRWELTMWRALRERLRGKYRVPTFGDYAIAYPKQLGGVPFAPAPQIRYTAGDDWLILKGRKNNRRSNFQFLEISERIAVQPGFRADLSWGDKRIAENALYANQEPPPEDAKPGNATVWRSIGTSHHMAYVMARLLYGEP